MRKVNGMKEREKERYDHLTSEQHIIRRVRSFKGTTTPTFPPLFYPILVSVEWKRIEIARSSSDPNFPSLLLSTGLRLRGTGGSSISRTSWTWIDERRRPPVSASGVD